MKKITGTIRYMDSLGRVVIPKELRESLRIDFGDPLEMHMEGNSLILSKHCSDKKFLTATFYEGVGNEILCIHAAHYDEAFKKLFGYYLEKGDRLGHWLDAGGIPVADFDNEAGTFENHPDWDFLIMEEGTMMALE